MTTIPASAIRFSYLLPCNATHAAFILGRAYGVKLSPLVLMLRWQEECATCAPLRELGDRPENGFDPKDERVILARKLIESLPDEVAA